MLRFKKMKKILLIGILILIPLSVSADAIGEKQYFYVDSQYDAEERDIVPATLQERGVYGYYYIEDAWWSDLSDEQRSQLLDRLNSLSGKFDSKIYPGLREVFGSEWRLGIDGNKHTTVFIHRMDNNAGGYVRTNDEHFRSHVENSNEREMVYLNTDSVLSPIAPSYLAHEFTHLITYNQKNRLQDASEEVWLNEARSEYASTILGYDEKLNGSNLEDRLSTFISHPTDSLTEWKGEEADYGALNLFTQYLVEKYGVEILVDSLHTRKTGIESINYALEKNGYDKEFGDVFSDWLVTSYANDCSLGKKYCYERDGLRGVSISPQVNFLPLDGSSSLGVSHRAKNWAGNWFKFVGGREGALKIEFIGNPNNKFEVPYLIRDFSGNYSLGYFELDSDQRGKILVSGFGTEISSVVIMPSVQTKVVGFTENEEEAPFFFEATTITEKEGLEREEDNDSSNFLQRPISEMNRGEVLTKISQLENLLQQLRNQLAVIEKEEQDVLGESDIVCGAIEDHLRMGMKSDKVKCLQGFLKEQGEEIYPEGLVTGYFGPLTKSAVVRFQDKYAEEVLVPWDLSHGTGYVGDTTLEKINSLRGF